MGRVHGRVTLDGKPVSGATVVFSPVAAGRRSQGKTNDNGEYTLTYIRDEQGAAVGTNNVRISKMPSHDLKSEVIPANYNQAPDQKRKVKPGDNQIDFDLHSK